MAQKRITLAWLHRLGKKHAGDYIKEVGIKSPRPTCPADTQYEDLENQIGKPSEKISDEIYLEYASAWRLEYDKLWRKIKGIPEKHKYGAGTSWTNPDAKPVKGGWSKKPKKRKKSKKQI